MSSTPPKIVNAFVTLSPCVKWGVQEDVPGEKTWYLVGDPGVCGSEVDPGYFAALAGLESPPKPWALRAARRALQGGQTVTVADAEALLRDVIAQSQDRVAWEDLPPSWAEHLYRLHPCLQHDPGEGTVTYVGGPCQNLDGVESALAEKTGVRVRLDLFDAALRGQTLTVPQYRAVLRDVFDENDDLVNPTTVGEKEGVHGRASLLDGGVAWVIAVGTLVAVAAFPQHHAQMHAYSSLMIHVTVLWLLTQALWKVSSK
jgi:hypothetical protein